VGRAGASGTLGIGLGAMGSHSAEEHHPRRRSRRWGWPLDHARLNEELWRIAGT
jgi:hypothetical protein